jgi:hypothetical protein
MVSMHTQSFDKKLILFLAKQKRKRFNSLYNQNTYYLSKICLYVSPKIYGILKQNF